MVQFLVILSKIQFVVYVTALQPRLWQLYQRSFYSNRWPIQCFHNWQFTWCLSRIPR